MQETKAPPKRSEMDPKYTWATEDMFASDELWQKALEKAGAYKEQIASYQGRLCENADTLYSYLQLSEKIDKELSLLYNYANRKSDEDTANSKYQDMCGKILSFIVELSSITSFETPEILAVSDDTLKSFLEAKPQLRLYSRYLDQIRRKKEHILSAAEERILALSGEICQAPEQIGSVFRDADLKFPDVTDSAGKSYSLTSGSYGLLRENADRTLRKNAFETFFRRYEAFKNTTAAFLDAQVKQLIFHARARNYANTLEAALDQTEVPTSVYHNLIDTVHGNLKTLHKYIALRKKLMNLEELHMYDLYTPIVKDIDHTISFEEAKEATLNALAPLGEDYLTLLREGYANRWIDVYENEGKRSGAYSSGGDPHPYVLLNHKDTLDSQFTLAHEMGHALHTYLSRKNQPYVYSDYVIFVAEVASTCNEVLMMHYLLGKSTDLQERAYLINHFLEQFRTTLYRQTMFAEFELLMNQHAEKGEALTAELLSQLYYQLNQQYYGNDVVSDPEIAYEWAYIPHFFYDYYVFQYATGFSAAVALADRILKEGKPAVDDYIRFLSSGSSTDPISLLKIAGVDMTSPEPIQKALALFDRLIDEMEALLT